MQEYRCRHHGHIHLISIVLFLTLCAFIKTIRICSPVTADGTAVALTVGGTAVTIVFAAFIADGDAPTGSATRLTAPVLLQGNFGDTTILVTGRIVSVGI